MELEPNREWTMDGRAVENDFQLLEDMDGTSTSRGHDVELRQESLPDSNGNSVLVEEGDCRICFKQASAEDPILELGCQCKNDLCYGHESCLTKWYVQRLRSRGTSDCEICRSLLGPQLEMIVRNKFQEEESLSRGVLPVRHFHESQAPRPPLQLLFQIPHEELDRLQVPLETPPWNDLPRETRRELMNFMNRQEEMYLHGTGTRHSGNLMAMAYIAAAFAQELPHSVEEMQAIIGEAIELRDRVIGGSGELVDLFSFFAEISDSMRGPEESADHWAHWAHRAQIRDQNLVDGRDPGPNNDEEQITAGDIDGDMDVSDEVQFLGSDDDELHTVENGEVGDIDDDDLEFFAFWDRRVVAVDAEHVMPLSDDELENELNEISAHVSFLATNGGGDMLYEFVRLSERHTTSRRDQTYGRYRTLLLLNTPMDDRTGRSLAEGPDS